MNDQLIKCTNWLKYDWQYFMIVFICNARNLAAYIINCVVNLNALLKKHFKIALMYTKLFCSVICTVDLATLFLTYLHQLKSQSGSEMSQNTC